MKRHKFAVVILFLFVALIFTATPATAQYCYPTVIHYGCPIYSAPVYVYPPAYVSPPTVIYVDPPVIYRNASPIETLPVADATTDDGPQPVKIWHPGRWERVRVSYTIREWQPARWVDDGPNRQILQEGRWMSVRKTGWETKEVHGYYTYVYPDNSSERSVERVAGR
jgi:hypothetical protein